MEDARKQVFQRMEELVQLLHRSDIPADHTTSHALHWLGCTGLLREGVPLRSLIAQTVARAESVLQELRQKEECARPREGDACDE